MTLYRRLIVAEKQTLKVYFFLMKNDQLSIMMQLGKIWFDFLCWMFHSFSLKIATSFKNPRFQKKIKQLFFALYSYFWFKNMFEKKRTFFKNVWFFNNKFEKILSEASRDDKLGLFNWEVENLIGFMLPLFWITLP